MEGDYVECRVLDVYGRTYVVLPGNGRRVDVSAWPAGLYMLRFVLEDGGLAVGRIVVR